MNNNNDNQIVVKRNYKKKIIAKLKKLKLYIYNKNYHRAISLWTFLDFIKIIGFIVIL